MVAAAGERAAAGCGGVILLVSKAHGTLVRVRDRQDPVVRGHLGRLLHPLDGSRVQDSLDAGFPVAADNRAFVGFEEDKFRALLVRVAGMPLLFVTAPDVVGDAAATDALWREWAPVIAAHGLRAAYVAQDGYREAPADAGAVFIGGSTEFKLGPVAARIVAEARRRGKWIHMGRVNTVNRIRYAATIGCDSFDGTQWSRWRDTHLPSGLIAAANAAAGHQLRLVED